MTWVRLDDGIYDHPKMLSVAPSDRLLYVWGLCWSARHGTDGVIPTSALPYLALFAGADTDASSRLVAAGLLAGVAGNAFAQAGDTIKVGILHSLSGTMAISETVLKDTVLMAVDEINAKGGVLGKKLELVVEDNKSNPTEAAAVAEKLITSDKTPVMMGAWGSSLTLAVMPKLADYETPMLVETSSSGKITTSGNPYVFRISPPSSPCSAPSAAIPGSPNSPWSPST